MEGSGTLDSYVSQIGEKLLEQVPVSMVVTVIGVIIGLIAIPVFLWKFGRKGFGAIKAALMGKNAGI